MVLDTGGVAFSLSPVFRGRVWEGLIVCTGGVCSGRGRGAPAGLSEGGSCGVEIFLSEDGLRVFEETLVFVCASRF